MKKIAFLSGLMLAGCAAHSGVVPVGPDTYYVSRQASTGLTGMGNLTGEALGEAGQFCTSKGKTVQVLSQSDSKPPYIFGNFPKTEIKFTCV